MGKIKTHSSSKKRFSITGTGKVKRFKTNKRHLLNCKSTKRKRQLRGSVMASTTTEKTIKAMIPYM